MEESRSLMDVLFGRLQGNPWPVIRGLNISLQAEPLEAASE
jgi:hypothetical protein